MLLNRRVQLALGLSTALLLLFISARSRLALSLLEEVRPSSATGVLEASVPGTAYAPPIPDWDEWPSANATKSRQKSSIRAAFVVLARNSDLAGILGSMRQLEDRFNRRFHYPWIFINDEPFTEHFITQTSGVASGHAHYGQTPEGHWGPPDWIDQDRAAAARQAMQEAQILYGDSVSYRNMCRYQSGWFQHHPLLAELDYYWRVEPDVKFFCDILEDPFVTMRDQGKIYGWVISIYEYKATIETLWETVREFFRQRPELQAERNSMDWISNDGGATYNLCQFWDNFEIGQARRCCLPTPDQCSDLRWLRSEPYTAYFNHLDRSGGFSYERWGDAAVHSIAAAIMLPTEQLHFFTNIGYRHEPFQHCPSGPQKDPARCWCDPQDTFEHDSYSCTDAWQRMINQRRVFGSG